jgi:uncharacterized protein (TIGR02145 family)
MKSLERIVSISAIALMLFFIWSNIADSQTKQPVENVPPKSVKIGNQEWMVMNLNVARFRNGDIIPEAKTNEEWKQAGKVKKPVWCYYENNAEKGKKYGRLYNWYAATDKRGIAPEGWHVPSNSDWSALVKTLGRIDMAGRRLKDTVDWKVKDRADNKSGFSGLPGGIRTADGKFINVGISAQWWSTSGEIGAITQVYSLRVVGSSVEAAFIKLEKENGLSIRCIKD